MISPFTLSFAVSGSKCALTHRKYISSTEIRKFGSELPAKLNSRVISSSSESLWSAVRMASGSATRKASARLPSARIAV